MIKFLAWLLYGECRCVAFLAEALEAPTGTTSTRHCARCGCDITVTIREKGDDQVT